MIISKVSESSKYSEIYKKAMSNSHSLSFVNGSIAKVIMAYIFAEEIAAGDQKLSTASQFFSNGVCIKKKNTYNFSIPLDD